VLHAAATENLFRFSVLFPAAGGSQAQNWKFTVEKYFNVTGCCNPAKHYMADISAKLEQVLRMVERGDYFAINRPRQYGKTTLLNQLARHLWRQTDKYILARLSFEGVGDTIFQDEAVFSPRFVEMLANSLEYHHPETADMLRREKQDVVDLETLSRLIGRFAGGVEQSVIVLIDEVDKSSNNQLFVSFLGMLRDKYLDRDLNKDGTFHSVILAGVHDVKSLKLRLRGDDERKLNSPWNIAADFHVDMSFSPAEIAPMLETYARDRGVNMNASALSERIHYYTGGYPFLVSKICKILDEESVGNNPDYAPDHWTRADVDWAFRWLTREAYSTTNFEDLVKNLENNPPLYELVYDVVFGTRKEGVPFSLLEPVTNLGVQFGIFIERNRMLAVSNLVYEQILTNYMRAKSSVAGKISDFESSLDYYDDGKLNLHQVLRKFQEFMKEHYSERDAAFLEREGRLVFMSFLKPIINGQGFMWKEPVVGHERRMDIVVTYGGSQKEVVELKIWRGEEYHQLGLQQLSDYLDFQGIDSGFLLIFDLSKTKRYKAESIKFADKDIFAVRV